MKSAYEEDAVKWLESIATTTFVDWIEQGLTSHQTHYRSYWGQVFTSQMI